MGRIIRFNPDRHEQARTLLPWYLRGRLEDEERARLEAHLSGCAECQAELRLERRLAEAVAELPFQADEGWAQMRRRIEAQAARSRPFPPARRALMVLGGGGWALAAQFAAVAVLMALVLPLARAPAYQAPPYHALGATRPAAVGDVIVVFQPEARAQDLTRILRASGARLIDGPTAADAYVLDVPLAARPAALASLRADAAVAMAEPIDAAERP